MNAAVWRSLSAFGLACVCLQTLPVRAEQASTRCENPWWVESAAIPKVLEDVPRRPTIYLPANIAPLYAGATLPDEAKPHELRVSDSLGQAVPGEIEFTTANVLGAGDNIVMRWRPLDDLEPGARYEATLTMPDSPVGWEMAGCPQRPGFSTGVTFTIATSEPEAPRVELEVEMSHRWNPWERLVVCTNEEWDARCGEVNPELCCVRTKTETRWTEASFVVRGSLPPPFYSAVVIELILPGTPRRPGPPWTYIEADQPYSMRYDGWHLVSRPEGDLPCVEIRLHSLLNGDESAPLATTRECFGADRLVLVPEPPPLSVCDSSLCEPYRPPVEDYPDVVGDDGAEAEQHADPDPERSASGCEGAPPAIASLLVVVAFSVSRRLGWGRGS